KWLHCRILSVLVCASASTTNGAEIAGARPAAPAAAPARFRKLRRVMVDLDGFSPDCIGGLLRKRVEGIFGPTGCTATTGRAEAERSRARASRDTFLARAAHRPG